MALVLALYPDEPYNDFYVDDIRVTLEDMRHEYYYRLKVHGEVLNTIHEITDKRAVEILPGVRVSAGNKANTERHSVKAVIEAPRRIAIYRGDIYRKMQEDKARSG